MHDMRQKGGGEGEAKKSSWVLFWGQSSHSVSIVGVGVPGRWLWVWVVDGYGCGR
jgi:hypothetical protein